MSILPAAGVIQRPSPYAGSTSIALLTESPPIPPTLAARTHALGVGHASPRLASYTVLRYLLLPVPLPLHLLPLLHAELWPLRVRAAGVIRRPSPGTESIFFAQRTEFRVLRVPSEVEKSIVGAARTIGQLRRALFPILGLPSSLAGVSAMGAFFGYVGYFLSTFRTVDQCHVSPLPGADSKPLVNVTEFRVLDRLQRAARTDISHRMASAPLRFLAPGLLRRLLTSRFVLRPLLRGGGQVVALAADVNHVAGVGDEVVSLESLGLGLADDVVRVEHSLVAANAARSPDADHEGRSTGEAINPMSRLRVIGCMSVTLCDEQCFTRFY